MFSPSLLSLSIFRFSVSAFELNGCMKVASTDPNLVLVADQFAAERGTVLLHRLNQILAIYFGTLKTDALPHDLHQHRPKPQVASLSDGSVS